MVEIAFLLAAVALGAMIGWCVRVLVENHRRDWNSRYGILGTGRKLPGAGSEPNEDPMQAMLRDEMRGHIKRGTRGYGVRGEMVEASDWDTVIANLYDVLERSVPYLTPTPER